MLFVVLATGGVRRINADPCYSGLQRMMLHIVYASFILSASLNTFQHTDPSNAAAQKEPNPLLQTQLCASIKSGLCINATHLQRYHLCIPIYTCTALLSFQVTQYTTSLFSSLVLFQYFQSNGAQIQSAQPPPPLTRPALPSCWYRNTLGTHAHKN